MEPTGIELINMRGLIDAVDAAPVRPTPNPRVGCRIIDADGNVISEGIHGTHGADHAEVIALRNAGDRAAGATALVTLEPCSHFGKTPPCTNALISAGIGRVVFGTTDPTADAAGGAELLTAAGIEVVGGVLADETDALVEPWWFSINHKRPFVTLKIASTLDGYVAATDGSSRWITGELARAEVHKLRSRVDAVAVGSATAVVDDPLLDVRLEGEWPQPARYVIGMRQLPPLRMSNMKQLRTHSPAEALDAMYEDGMRHVMIEGGAKLAAAFLTAGLVDQLIWFVAPKLLGDGVEAIAGLGISNINDASTWHLLGTASFGSDVRLDLRPANRAR